MELGHAQSRGRSIAARGVSFALVAALAFGAGLAVGGSGSTASIVSNIPLIGDGLDATPDQRADLTDFWKAWNALEANYVITDASSTLPSVKERIFGAIGASPLLMTTRIPSTSRRRRRKHLPILFPEASPASVWRLM